MDCLVTLTYPDQRTAEVVLMAVERDNAGFADCCLQGPNLIIRMNAKSEPSMLHTLEDLLSCVKVAEEICRKISG